MANKIKNILDLTLSKKSCTFTSLYDDSLIAIGRSLHTEAYCQITRKITLC